MELKHKNLIKIFESKLMSMEMEFLRISTRCSRLEKLETMLVEKKDEY